MKMKKGFRQLVDEAKARITTIGLDEAKRRHGRDDVVFVDLRDVRELEREGMIPGAFHCPRGMLEFWIDPDSPYHKDVFASGKEFVFYCNGARRSPPTSPSRWACRASSRWTAASRRGRTPASRSRSAHRARSPERVGLHHAGAGCSLSSLR